MGHPLLFAIKRYALHDGPNIRTTVFFKGCPLNCFWCHNPEGIGHRPEVVTIGDRCIGCRECLHGCPTQALSLTTEGIARNEESCTTCLECVEICPALAHEAVGYQSSVDEVMLEIEKDLPFYDQSGGGVTFSGGEPLAQPQALLALLVRCGARGIHRVVDTSGYGPLSTLLEIAHHTELFLYDLKHMDSGRHAAHTGVPNELILANLQALSRSGASFYVRIPLLAGINDDEDNVTATARFLQGLPGLLGVDILPYHHMAAAKYTKLRSGYSGGEHHRPTRESIDRTEAILVRFGHQVRQGG